MKVIDEKGRIFGKINVLDAAILIVFCITIVSAYMFIVHRDKLKSVLLGEDEKWYTTIEVIANADDIWMKRHIKAGDALRDSRGKPVWQILDVKEIPDENGQKRLLLKLRLAVLRERTGALYYGKYTLIVGGEIILDKSDYSIKGIIYSLGDLEERIPY